MPERRHLRTQHLRSLHRPRAARVWALDAAWEEADAAWAAAVRGESPIAVTGRDGRQALELATLINDAINDGFERQQARG